MTHRREVLRHCAGRRRTLTIAILTLLLPAAARAQPEEHDLTVTTPAEVITRRRELISHVWGTTTLPERLPDVSRDVPSPLAGLRNLRRVDELRVDMDAQVQGLAYHFVPQLTNGRAVIVHNGHSCSFEGVGLETLIDELLAARYAVLAVFMPGMTPTDCRAVPHDPLFEPANAPATGSPMRYFLEPVVADVNYLRSRSQLDDFPLYRQIDMIGHSGGGWTTTVYAAIDPRIRLSFSVAGSIPLDSRAGGSRGDTEQFVEDFYRIAGYRDLYVLGTRERGRKQLWILTRRDPCCFGEREDLYHDPAGRSWDEVMRGYEAEVTGALGSLGAAGSFRLLIDETSEMHEVSPSVASEIMAELASSQRARPGGGPAQ